MKCYQVTITGFVITSDDANPPDLWDYKILLGEISQQPVMDVTIEEMRAATHTTPQRKCGACGELGHNRRRCLNA